MSLCRISRVVGLSLLCGFLLSGCGANGHGATHLPTLVEVKKFDPYRVYYAGRKSRGLPLEGVSKGRAGRWIYWGFGYGDCSLHGRRHDLDESNGLPLLQRSKDAFGHQRFDKATWGKIGNEPTVGPKSDAPTP